MPLLVTAFMLLMEICPLVLLNVPKIFKLLDNGEPVGLYEIFMEPALVATAAVELEDVPS